MKTILLLLFAVCYSVSGVAIPNGRVAGGYTASEKEFPYMVSITDNERHFCGGWIYSPGWVVTAASCIANKTAGSLSVVVGSVRLTTVEPAEQTIGVFNSYLFYGYNATSKENDIALLKLMSDIRFDDNDIVDDDLTFPLAVNNVRYTESDSNLPGTVVGWGATFQGGFESTNLHYGNVNVVPNGQPCSDYGNQFFPSTMLCAMGANNTEGNAGSPCIYDQGGPLLQTVGDERFVVGIVSIVKPCDPYSYVLYTRVSPFYAWLARTAGDQPLPLAPLPRK